MALETYRKKRDFERTPEPAGRMENKHQKRFVVQEHHASHLHFDFRLEIGGVLKSWAIPKGPSMDPSEKRLAVQVEDHPVAYMNFEGEISEGNYGAGQVRVWDAGTFRLLVSGTPEQAYDAGKLSIELNGAKLKGNFGLVRMANRKNQWLLIKARDDMAQPGWKLETLLPSAGESGKSNPGTRSKVPPRTRPSGKRTATQVARKTVVAPAVSLQEFLEGPPHSKNVVLTLGTEKVTLTNLDKEYFSKARLTKGDLVRYYLSISEIILPYLRDRPLILKRFPNGVDKKFFYQHDLTAAPDFVHTRSLESEEGREIDYALIDSAAALAYVTNLGTIEEHPWSSRIDNLEFPDWVVFDLDPEQADWNTIRDVAFALRETLTRFRLESWVKTSGSRGLHLYVPIQPKYTFDQVAAFAERTAARVARENSKCATVQRSLARREPGRIYIDHLQNARGKTVAAPYSVRARPEATVSTPITWSELEVGIDPREFNVLTLPTRLTKLGDLFAPVIQQKQSLENELE